MTNMNAQGGGEEKCIQNCGAETGGETLVGGTSNGKVDFTEIKFKVVE